MNAADTFQRFFRHWLAATRSFSQIPVPASLQETGVRPEPSAAVPHLPGVGLLVGLAACMLFAIVSLPLPQGPLTPLVAAVAATIATVTLTGALHEDALLRDVGVVVLVLVLAAKLSLLAVLGVHLPAGALAALLAAHAVSRFWVVLVAYGLPHVGGAPRDPLAHPVDGHGLAVAGAWCVVPLLVMVLAGGVTFVLVALIASTVTHVVLRRRLQRRLGGYTPDSLGSAQQVTEVAFYLGAAFGVGR